MCENGQNTRGHIKLDEKMEVSDGGRLELKPPQGSAKARSFRCAGVPGRPERFRRRHPKAHPDVGMTRSKDPGLERFVRLGGTIVLDSDPIICSLSTELIAKNSREVQSAT